MAPCKVWAVEDLQSCLCKFASTMEAPWKCVYSGIIIIIQPLYTSMCILTAGVHCLFSQNPLIRPSLDAGLDFVNSDEMEEAMGRIVANNSDIFVQVTNV